MFYKFAYERIRALKKNNNPNLLCFCRFTSERCFETLKLKKCSYVNARFHNMFLEIMLRIKADVIRIQSSQNKFIM